MTLWECFVCGSDTACSHREPELLLWAKRNGLTFSTPEEIKPKPPVRVLAPVTVGQPAPQFRSGLSPQATYIVRSS